MASSMIRNGVGCERDSELESGVRLNNRTWLLSDRERREVPLGLTDALRHRDFLEGDLMSESDGKLVPFKIDAPFAGVLDRVGEDQRGRYVGSVITRGIFVADVEGFSADTKPGAPIRALPSVDHRCRFTVDAIGVLVGEVVNCEVKPSGNLKAHVGLRLPGDVRPYTSGSRSDPFNTTR